MEPSDHANYEHQGLERVDPREIRHALARPVAVVFGTLLHLIVGWFYLFTPLIAPAWAAITLNVVWLALAWLGWRWRQGQPLRLLAIPFIAAGLWWAAVTAGDVWLGWTA